ncbi:MAG: 4Fe-4S dicluster domain-containing protein [Blastochloris sp.]|nr:4Fe-4S dicluster domain-containing protein [Blastochloris sp.]
MCRCRAGFCGACPTIYRKAGDHRLHTALACQTLVEDGMCLVQVPYVPVAKKLYDIEQVKPEPNIILQYYPEVARCIACNTCSKACPQGIVVMDYIQAALRGDIERAALLSFDCISCGICSSRCPADIKHYPVGQLVRRLYGKYILPVSPHLAQRMQELEAGRFELLALLLKLLHPLDQFILNIGNGKAQLVFGGNKVLGRVNINRCAFGQDFARQRVDIHNALDLVAPEGHPQRRFAVGGHDVERITTHTERSPLEVHIFAVKLQVNQLAQQLVTVAYLTNAQRDSNLPVVLRRSQAVNCRY